MIHELSVLHALAGDLEHIDTADSWAADASPGSVAFTGRLPGGARVSMAWHYLPDYPAYREEVRVHHEGGSVSLVFPSPYLLHAPTRLVSTRLDGATESRGAGTLLGGGVRDRAGSVPCARDARRATAGGRGRGARRHRHVPAHRRPTRGTAWHRDRRRGCGINGVRRIGDLRDLGDLGGTEPLTDRPRTHPAETGWLRRRATARRRPASGPKRRPPPGTTRHERVCRSRISTWSMASVPHDILAGSPGTMPAAAKASWRTSRRDARSSLSIDALRSAARTTGPGTREISAASAAAWSARCPEPTCVRWADTAVTMPAGVSSSHSNAQRSSRTPTGASA